MTNGIKAIHSSEMMNPNLYQYPYTPPPPPPYVYHPYNPPPENTHLTPPLFHYVQPPPRLYTPPFILTCHTTLSTGQPFYAVETISTAATSDVGTVVADSQRMVAHQVFDENPEIPTLISDANCHQILDECYEMKRTLEKMDDILADASRTCEKMVNQPSLTPTHVSIVSNIDNLEDSGVDEISGSKLDDGVGRSSVIRYVEIEMTVEDVCGQIVLGWVPVLGGTAVFKGSGDANEEREGVRRKGEVDDVEKNYCDDDICLFGYALKLFDESPEPQLEIAAPQMFKAAIPASHDTNSMFVLAEANKKAVKVNSPQQLLNNDKVLVYKLHKNEYGKFKDMLGNKCGLDDWRSTKLTNLCTKFKSIRETQNLCSICEMDSRESSSSSDDGSISITAPLAKEASLLFQSAKFIDCLKVLHQLLQHEQGDPKVLHNIAIVENIQDGFSNPKKFLEVLNNVKKRSEKLATACGENLEGVGNSESNVVAVSNGNTCLTPQSLAANGSTILLNAEFATHVASYNIAVTWFNLCEYSKSFSILDPVYQKIAPISEGIALRICLLLLDVALLSHHALRSAGIIDYVEKISSVRSMISQGENVSSTQQQPPNLVTKTSSVPSAPIPDISSADSATNASEVSLSRSLSEEAEYENLFSTLDMSGQNLSRPSVLHSVNDISRTQVDDSFPITDLRLKLHLYKVRLLLLTRNPKAAKREVKMAMNIARGNNSMVLFLKSQLEYARGNHPKAIKLLMALSNRTEIVNSIMFYNNLGCIHYRLGKHQTSAVYFSKALSTSSVIRKEKPQNQTHTSFSLDKSLLVAYNCGMQYLACGKPILAARCFHKASLVFYTRPLLWLRIAECCLMALEKGLLDSTGDASTSSEIKVHVVGKGKWRNLVMEDGVPKNSQADFVGRRDSLLGYNRQPKLSMSLARQCLLNALQLLNSSESVHMSSGLPSDLAIEGEAHSKSTNCKSVSGGDSQEHNLAVASNQVANGELKEQKGASAPNATLRNSISDYEDICRKEIQKIRLSVLADLAYVELELGNPLKALSTARTLLKVAECSRIYIFLGNVYAAEALCLLNRSKEAVEHLLIYLSSGNNVELPFTQEDCELWRVGKTVDCEDSNGGPVAASNASDEGKVFALNPEEARGTLYANLATMSAIQGDLEQADKFVRQALSTLPNSPGAILTAIYLDLMLGNPHEAITKLKNCSHITFLPGSFAVTGSS